MPGFAMIVNVLQLAAKERTQLVLESIALRHQLADDKRSVGEVLATPVPGALHHRYSRAS